MGAEQQQKQQQQQGRRRPSGRVEAGANGGDGRCDSSGGRETVLLHLWDEQTCLTSLFQKGDGLAVYWPWLAEQQQSGDSIHDDSVPLTGRGTSSQQNSLSSQVRQQQRQRYQVLRMWHTRGRNSYAHLGARFDFGAQPKLFSVC